MTPETARKRLVIFLTVLATVVVLVFLLTGTAAAQSRSDIAGSFRGSFEGGGGVGLVVDDDAPGGTRKGYLMVQLEGEGVRELEVTVTFSSKLTGGAEPTFVVRPKARPNTPTVCVLVEPRTLGCHFGEVVFMEKTNDL